MHLILELRNILSDEEDNVGLEYFFGRETIKLIVSYSMIDCTSDLKILNKFNNS